MNTQLLCVCGFTTNCSILETKREQKHYPQILVEFILPVKNNLLIFSFIVFVLVAFNQLVRFIEDISFTIMVDSEKIS